MIKERREHPMDYPQWLLPAFMRNARAAGASVPDEELESAALRLIERWSEPGRHHHGVHHLGDMLSRITTLASETHNPELVALAAFYHGCVFSTADKDTYTRNGGENEIDSAHVARGELIKIGIEPKIADRVAALIAGIKKQPKEIDPTISTTLNVIDIDKLALRDAHLGALAAPPQRYTKYLDEVEQEYSHVPERDFLRARREILGKLLARRQIFLSPLGRQWEAPARDNLEGELERIETRLSAIAEQTPTLENEPPAEWEHPTLDEAEQGAETGDMQGGPLTPEEFAQSRATAPTERLADAEIAPTSSDEGWVATETSEQTIRSSLETLPDESEAGSPPRQLKGEEKKRAEREEIARKMQERIIRRQAGLADVEPELPVAEVTPPLSADSPLSAPTASTPEWIDEPDDTKAGFEREPDY